MSSYAALICTHNPNINYLLDQINSIKASSDMIDILICDFNSSFDIRKKIDSLDYYSTLNIKLFEFAKGPKHSFYTALNWLIKEFSYDYTFLVDQDDIWHKEKFSSIANILSITNADLIFHDVLVFDGVNHNNSSKTYYEIKKRKPVFESDQNMMQKSNIGIGHTFVMSKDLIKGFLNFSLKDSFPMHDWAILFFASYGKKYKVYYFDLPLSFYRIHDGNCVGLNKRKNLEKFNFMLAHIKSLSDLRISLYKSNYSYRFFPTLLNCYRVGFKRLLLELIVNILTFLREMKIGKS
jgi:hypothetical protein